MFKLQNSFLANEQGLILEPYRDAVHNGVPNWTMCPLLPGSVSDPSWLDKWQEQLDQSHGVLVIFTEGYRQKCKDNGSTAVLREARRIMARMRQDKSFRVYVLDPDKADQGSMAFGFLLIQGQKEMNSQGWLQFVKRHMSLRL